MRVRCLEIVHPDGDVPVAEFDGIRVGGVYAVLEMVTYDLDCQIRVLGPGTPDPGLLWDPASFETVDTRIPPGWTLVIADGHTRLADTRWQRPGFWTAYANSDPQAQADYDQVKRELLTPAPPMRTAP
ncbi:hypothetical protein P3T36_001711 [Kitasatospora sp. MAP12-15]|uniref:hypothetical protein n=1 Tax=unclassified Kitasatospora TaxID=2633591 RepID=UPI0024755FDF|nr:hypothetical protein [Kitasatospora sp. MAP12-44]MDH6113410.1 hypothetical protein [Kitasatospora sp. MAP12-44]